MPLLLGADGARDDLRMDDRIDDDGLGPFRKARAALSPDAAHEVVIAPADPGPGSWAGAPSALRVDGTFVLAYRLRRPVGQGRGYANVVATSEDGVRFRTVATLAKESFGAESLERPALAVTPEGRWRAYVSAATPGTKHWRGDAGEGRTPPGAGPPPPPPRLGGGAPPGVQDPGVV